MTALAAKDPDVAATYSVNVHDDLVQIAQRDVEFATNAIARPQYATGWYYVATPLNAQATGRTARHWPAWPRAAAATVIDGSISWAATHPASASVPTIDSVVWDVPSGITKDSQLETDSVAQITLSGGTDGEDYDLTATITYSDGRVVEHTITIPVRSQ